MTSQGDTAPLFIIRSYDNTSISFVRFSHVICSHDYYMVIFFENTFFQKYMEIIILFRFVHYLFLEHSSDSSISCTYYLWIDIIWFVQKKLVIMSRRYLWLNLEAHILHLSSLWINLLYNCIDKHKGICFLKILMVFFPF